MSNQKLISVRKLAALDIFLHSAKLILLEFGGSLILCPLLGVWFIYRTIGSGPNHSIVISILGGLLIGIGLNYLPQFIYAIKIVGQKSAAVDIAQKMAYPEVFTKMYGLQSVIFILIPLALLIIALIPMVANQRVSR